MIDSVAQPPPDIKRARQQPPGDTLDRLPPHSPEGEAGVLGCVLLAPDECMAECIEKLKEPEAFYDLRNQTVYGSMLEMYDSREAIDVITLQQHLKDRQMLDQVGGIVYLSTLADSVPSAANLSYYLTIVQEKWELRQLVRICTETAAGVYDYQGDDYRVLMEEHERAILRLMAPGGTQQRTIKESVFAAVQVIENYHQGIKTGVMTGLRDLDNLTGGMQLGEMTILAARPSVGKTSLAMTIAEHVSVDQKLPVGVFSLEMTTDALVLRMLCSMARCNARNIRDGYLCERDFPKLTNAAGKLQAAPLYIDDSSGLTILQLRAKARRLHQLYGIKLLVIDYLQLLHGTSKRSENRQQEVTEISGGIKSLAKELNIPVLVLCQLNRDMEKGGKKESIRKPRMSDLRESGSLEQDADDIWLLWKPDEQVQLVRAKSRNGATDDVNLTFLKEYTRFEDAAKVQDEDLPQ